MNVYFTASIVGKKDYLPQYQKIIQCVTEKHHTILYDHILHNSEEKINLQTISERETFHKKLKNDIASADCVIVEGSFSSISVGFEICLALNMRKPVLLLYTTTHPPSLLEHYKDEGLILEKYNMNSLSEILDEYFNYVQGASDTRFTFFITSKIATFLDKMSKKHRLPKSVYLRKLIEKEMT